MPPGGFRLNRKTVPLDPAIGYTMVEFIFIAYTYLPNHTVRYLILSLHFPPLFLLLLAEELPTIPAIILVAACGGVTNSVTP